jgi:hypothetical protein
MKGQETTIITVLTHALLFFSIAWFFNTYITQQMFEGFVKSPQEYEEKIQAIFNTIRPYMKHPNEIDILYDRVKKQYKTPEEQYGYIYTMIGQPSDRKISALRDRQNKERKSIKDSCVKDAQEKHITHMKLKAEFESKPEYKQYESERQKVQAAAAKDIASKLTNPVLARAEIDRICFMKTEEKILATEDWDVALKTIL